MTRHRSCSTEFYNSSCPVVHSAVSFLDTTTYRAAPLMDAAVAPVRCPPERTGAWTGTESCLENWRENTEQHEGFVEGVAVAGRLGSSDYLYLIEWLRSCCFTAHQGPIKREGSQPLVTLEVS